MKEKIKFLFKELNDADREELKYAHQFAIPKFVELKTTKNDKKEFIGCFCNGVPFLEIEETYNDWYYGTVNYDYTRFAN